MGETLEIAAFLRTVPLFAELEPEHLLEIARHATPFQAAAGTTLFRQGDDGDGLYVLAAGRVQVTTRLLGENKVALSNLGRGDLLGEMSLLDGRVRSASARCTEDATGYFVRRTHFAMLRADLHPVALRLMRSFARMLSQRQRAFNDEIAAIAPPPEWTGPGRSIPPPPFDSPYEVATAHLSRDILRAIPLFASLGDAKLEQLLAAAKAWAVPRGHVLCEKGGAGDSCFITVRGAVRVALMQGTFSETLAIVPPGRIVGHMALVDGGPRSATCIVRENAIVLELAKSTFDAWCAERNPLAFDLLERMTLALVDALRSSGGLMARFAVEGRVHQRVQNMTLPADQLPMLPGPTS